MKTITLIDDCRIDSQLIKAWLEDHQHYQIQNVYHSSVDAITNANEIKTDFCLIDAHMPLLSGVDTIALLVKKGYAGKIILISHAFSLKHLTEAKHAGACGYCHKNRQSLIDALSKIGMFNNCFDDLLFEEWDSLTKQNNLHLKDKDPKVELLNTHHYKILLYSSKGLTTDEMAGLMQLKKHTIEQYRANMLQLLGFTSMAQATAWAVAIHIVRPGDVNVPSQNQSIN